MSKRGYLICTLLMLALAVFVCWPQRNPDGDGIAVFAGDRPLVYRLRANGIEQEIKRDQVRVQGVLRPLDGEKANALWSFIANLIAGRDQVVESVSETALAAYGIDGTRELAASTLRLRWGTSGDKGYLWEGVSGRVFVASTQVVARCDALARRLDRDQLVVLERARRIEIDRLPLVLADQEWIDALHRGRPPFSRRVERLEGLIAGLRLVDFAGKAPVLAPILGSVRLGAEDPLVKDQVIRLWTVGEGAVVQVDELPAQTLDAATSGEWRACLADFQRDYLFNLERQFRLMPLSELIVSRAGAEWFRLEKHGLRDVDQGRSQWDVVWSGGREVAAGEAAARIADAFDRLAVRDPQPRGEDKPPADAIAFEFVFQTNQRHLRIDLAGDQVWSTTHRATIAEASPALSQLGPEAMLDLGLADRPAERVVKIQRVFHDETPERSEVFAVGGGGSWQQTHPHEAAARPLSQLAVERLARALCSARARSARLISDADRVILDHPDFEVALRFAPQPVRHSNDAARLDDTLSSDIGFAFAHEGDAWRAVDQEGAVSFLVDPEMVELLRLPLFDNLVLPLVPSLVRRIEVDGEKGHFALTLGEHGWSAQALDGDAKSALAQAADQVQVRRYLRLLATLHAKRVDEHAGPLLPSEVAATITCSIPAAEGADERLVLSLGKRAPGGQRALSAETTRLSGRAPGGRSYLDEDDVMLDALVPPLAGFIAAPAGR